MLAEEAGEGAEAFKGCTVRDAVRLFLCRGEEVTRDAESIRVDTGDLDTIKIEGVQLILHSLVIGQRSPIAGVWKPLTGMRAGGYREVEIAPHLGYGEKGIAGCIPENALLRARLRLVEVIEADS